jgi:hypothetical protein
MDYLAQNQLLFQPIFDVHDQQWFLMKVKTIRNVIKINNNKQNLQTYEAAQPKNCTRGIWFVCKSHHEF